MSPKFQVYKDSVGKTRFRIRADNNQIVAVGEAYEKYASCLKGIESVKRNCGAQIEDLTIRGGPRLPNPKYQIFEDVKGKFRFHLKAANGEIIALGEGYESREGCLDGINVVRGCASAKIEDPFAVKKQIFERPIEGKIVDVPKPQPSQAVKEEAPLAIKPETTTPRMPMPPVEKAAIVQLPKEEPKMLVPKLQKVSEPVIKTEDLIEEKLAPAEKEETIPEVYPFETTLELYSAPENISSGDKVVFRGRLFENKTGKGISDAKIRIYERDKSILGDDYLAYGSTGPDGSFAIPWRTRSLTWRKETGIIYAKFGGNEKAKSSKSTVQEITVK